jgi:hypothetical protein
MNWEMEVSIGEITPHLGMGVGDCDGDSKKEVSEIILMFLSPVPQSSIHSFQVVSIFNLPRRIRRGSVRRVRLWRPGK